MAALTVISGGQTGADRAGLMVARARGLATGGWMPKGFRAEDGLHPEFATLYGMRETGSPEYAERTVRNLIDGDLTLWFGAGDSSGRDWTLSNCSRLGRPYIDIPLPDGSPSIPDVAVQVRHVLVVNVAGHRESVQPGIEAWTQSWLEQLFDELAL